MHRNYPYLDGWPEVLYCDKPPGHEGEHGTTYGGVPCSWSVIRTGPAPARSEEDREDG